jgi:hypothetical protein
VDILNDSGAMNLMRSRQKVNNGAWHHFAVIREGNTIRVFLDGQAIVEESARGTGAITTKYRYIGSDEAAAEKGEKGDLLSFAGHIDEVRIYQKALSSQEVASLIRAP